MFVFGCFFYSLESHCLSVWVLSWTAQHSIWTIHIFDVARICIERSISYNTNTRRMCSVSVQRMHFNRALMWALLCFVDFVLFPHSLLMNGFAFNARSRHTYNSIGRNSVYASIMLGMFDVAHVETLQKYQTVRGIFWNDHCQEKDEHSSTMILVVIRSNERMTHANVIPAKIQIPTAAFC